MLLILTLWACWGPGPECVLVPTEAERACETTADCALVYTDCAQRCNCAGVNANAVDRFSTELAADCGTGACEEGECVRDCGASRRPACIRGRCGLYPAADDTGG